MLKLLKLNKKKAIYAIGEVLLILIGVFLGLQADRINENRKDSEREKLILTDIKNDLVESKSELNEDINFNKFSITQLEEINSILINPKSYENDIINPLALITEWKSPYLTSIAYQTFKGEELGLIKNQKLKKRIIRLNEVDMNSLSKDYDEIEMYFTREIVWPLLIRKMKPITNNQNYDIRPKNFMKLKKDDEFKMMINSLIQLRKKGVELMENCDKEISVAIKLIDKELT